jgi:hypothetical protein
LQAAEIRVDPEEERRQLPAIFMRSINTEPMVFVPIV